jgi:hypothetical protein
MDIRRTVAALLVSGAFLVAAHPCHARKHHRHSAEHVDLTWRSDSAVIRSEPILRSGNGEYPTFMLRYQLFDRANSYDLAGFAVSLLAAYAPAAVHQLRNAPVLPIPMFQHGAFGMALWGRLQ